MKLRTDFVTNSSSVSFIAVKIQTETETFIEELEGGGCGITPTDEKGYFYISENELRELSDIKQILQKICNWIYIREEEPYFSIYDSDDECDEDEDIEKTELNWDDCKQVFKYYSVSHSKIPNSIEMDKLKKIKIFSRMEYWDEPFGASLIEYDYESKEFKEQHRNPWEKDSLNEGEDYDSAYPSSDPYGDRLKEQFYDEEYDDEDYEEE